MPILLTLVTASATFSLATLCWGCLVAHRRTRIPNPASTVPA